MPMTTEEICATIYKLYAGVTDVAHVVGDIYALHRYSNTSWAGLNFHICAYKVTITDDGFGLSAVGCARNVASERAAINAWLDMTDPAYIVQMMLEQK